MRTKVFGIAALALSVPMVIGGAMTARASAAAVRSSDVPATSCLQNSYQDARTLASRSWRNGNEVRTIAVRYSTKCFTLWAKEYNGQPNDSFWIWGPGYPTLSAHYKDNASHITGNFAYGGGWVHACMVPRLSNGSKGPKTCTGEASP
jgi:hypothetical protein